MEEDRKKKAAELKKEKTKKRRGPGSKTKGKIKMANNAHANKWRVSEHFNAACRLRSVRCSHARARDTRGLE